MTTVGAPNGEHGPKGAASKPANTGPDGHDKSTEQVMGALAIVGLIVPNAMVAAFVFENGTDVGGYFASWFGTLPSGQLFADLAIVSVAFWVWSYYDHRRTGTPRWWLIPFATLTVGICFAVPLHLWIRERKVRISSLHS
ncbi:hypothetical protein C6I20_02895 [Aeromicrobium sp. A1-2]|uniref:DUF2834 domain-containing protein n=1 Tax=Aeromicrobium sp. A1-2 TaxID=2107713 RepID=UPI000E52995A|nr:DUF2834 domain-containing protein [Aeromicrobium sp. A1-2]AXT84242.1 hypothetical protein C6I20_02895 [Aeromicrobium sp. A1-2]